MLNAINNYIYRRMIQLTKEVTQYIYLTLTEKQLLTAPNYLFRFINRSSNEELKFVLINAKDISLFKDRYNKFSIVNDKYFASKLIGQYTYEVYEQTSATSVDIEGKNLLESGIMMLNNPVDVYKEYKTSDKFKIRK